MTRDQDMTSTPASHEKSGKLETKHHHAHCEVDEKTTFTAWATSGGSNLHQITTSPHKLGPKDVEIDIWYSGICGSDLHIIKEEWGKLHEDIVPGHQIAGKVVAAGNKANFKVGDRVGSCLVIDACLQCDECMAGQEQHCHKMTVGNRDNYCHPLGQGGFANRIRLCSDLVYKIPDAIKLSHAAPLFCSGVTAFTALRKFGAGAHKRLGVMGIGSLGHFVLQYAKAMGSRDIVVFSGDKINCEDMAKLGATRVVDFSNKDQMKEEKHNVDLLVVNSFDKSTNWEDVFSLVSNHGTILVLALSKEPIHIPTMTFVHRDIRVVSSYQGGRRDIVDMLKFSAHHKIFPWVVTVPFNKINDAIELQKQRASRYCVVLEADDSEEKGSSVEANKAVAEQYMKV
ncbi:hypothetical protein FBU30_006989 [Linnemannia zychae]|nr:hypothetical protein FBU30_006989 [Linnemannia zychae]